MIVKVLCKFLDKQTGIIHMPGDVFECTEERMNQILEVGAFVEPETVKQDKRGRRKS